MRLHIARGKEVITQNTPDRKAGGGLYLPENEYGPTSPNLQRDRAILAIMYSLYAKRLCPYARAAIGALHDAGQDFEVRYVEHEEHRDALQRQSGGSQVPFLMDEAANVHIGDSGAIIAYLQEKHGKVVEL